MSSSSNIQMAATSTLSVTVHPKTPNLSPLRGRRRMPPSLLKALPKAKSKTKSKLPTVAKKRFLLKALFEPITKKTFSICWLCRILQQMPKFQPMGKLDVDDESEYAPAINNETPDDDLDVDFDDGSDDDKNQHQNHHQNQLPR
jgi:hypothetical protein